MTSRRKKKEPSYTHVTKQGGTNTVLRVRSQRNAAHDYLIVKEPDGACEIQSSLIEQSIGIESVRTDAEGKRWIGVEPRWRLADESVSLDRAQINAAVERLATANALPEMESDA